MVSHCRSDNLSHQDPLNFLINPDQAGLKRAYTTTSPPLVDYPDLYLSFTGPQLDQLDLCSIAARSSPNQTGKIHVFAYSFQVHAPREFPLTTLLSVLIL